MLEPSHFFPPHITEILAALDVNELADRVLLMYHSKTIADPILNAIYSKLSYPEISEVSSKYMKSLILQEYMSDFPPIDLDLDQVKLLDDNFITHEIPENSLDFSKEELFEINSFASFHSVETNATPVKSRKFQAKITPRSKNGLKALSWKVKEIVEKLGRSTYQEVADGLIKDGNNGILKDEKNIRRRVYDALNVLISVGLLKKTGKKVEPLVRPHKDTNEKLQKLKEITQKYLALKGLIDRNRQKKLSFNCLFLPFQLVLVENGPAESQARVGTSLYKNRVTLKFDQNFHIQSSDDVLLSLKLTYDTAWLPTEVKALCNISYK